MQFDSNLIDFFQRHKLYNKDMFDYFSRNAIMIDYEDEEQRDFIGCFYILDEKKRLRNLYLNIPFVYNDITMLISIHELIHGIMLYKYLGKKVKLGIDSEVLPMLYEKIYINERNDIELIQYEERLNSLINTSKNKEYVLGLELREQLINGYDYDINKLDKRVKKLIKRNKGIY